MSKDDDIDEFGLDGPLDKSLEQGDRAPGRYTLGVDVLGGSVSLQPPVRGYKAKTQPVIVGIGPAEIFPHATTLVRTYPEVVFRGESLVNTGDTEDLLITNMTINGKQQLPTGFYGGFGKPIPVNHFKYSLLDSGVLFSTCHIGERIEFTIKNTGYRSRKFSMSMAGRTLLP